MTTAGTGTPWHYALFYDNPGDYASGIAAFLAEGMAAGEPALVAVPAARHGLIQAGLNGVGASAVFLDMTGLGANPSRIIPAIREFTSAHSGRRTRFVGEPIWSGRTPAETAEATRHEALLNTAFADEPVTICCPYDTSGLDTAVLADAARTHPAICHHGRHQPSPGYT